MKSDFVLRLLRSGSPQAIGGCTYAKKHPYDRNHRDAFALSFFAAASAAPLLGGKEAPVLLRLPGLRLQEGREAQAGCFCCALAYSKR